MRLRPILILIILAWSPCVSLAQREEHHTTTPNFQGVDANAPIPVHVHKRNEGGSDGAGLCVICSIKINGDYQGVPGTDELWRQAKRRPGGYSPTKLQSLLDEVMPDEKWASYVGRDSTVLHRLSAMGYPIGSTMNTGELYNMRPIHHMISLIHFDQERDLACVVDNNQPGVYTWMTSREYLKRWIDGGTGWAFVWLRKLPARFDRAGWICLIVAGGLLLVLASIRRRPAPVMASPLNPPTPLDRFSWDADHDF